MGLAKEFGQIPPQERSNKESGLSLDIVNRVVDSLRVNHYQPICGGRAPLLTPDRIFETEELSVLARRRLIKSSMLPAALMGEKLLGYNGTVANIEASVVKPTEIPVKEGIFNISPKYVDTTTLTAIDVNYDLIGTNGQKEGEVRQRYLHYLSSPDFNPYEPMKRSMANLVEQTLSFYSPAEIKKNRLLWFKLTLLNGREVMEIIDQNKRKHEKLVASARSREGQNITNPLFGGLPGLGRK